MPPSRRSVLHLMNGVGDSSITSIVVDQFKHFSDSRYDWHIAGLKGVAANEPFSVLGAKVVDFSRGAGGQFGIQRKLRNYVHENGIQLVHSHTPRTTLTAAFALGRRSCVKLLTTKHLHAISQERRAHGWFFWLADRSACYMSDQIIAVSKDVGSKLKSLPWIHDDKITVIQNAVDTALYDQPKEREGCRTEFSIGEHETVLGFAGRLTKQKRLDLMLQAFAQVLSRYDNCRLLLAGEGEEEEALRSLAEQLGIAGKVIWAGHRRDMPRLYAAIDIYVQSSDNEGLSLSLLQAMIARKAVVATNVGGTREVVNEQTGVLIEAGSSEILADAVIRLINQPESTDRMRENGCNLVKNEFGVGQQMVRYQAVYGQLFSD